MCYIIITLTSYRCNHRPENGRHQVDCNSRDCSLSQYHKEDEHDCISSCRQRQVI
ncbi:hypothetical protein JAAARDRAFT_141443 [Jaapia argillacea MUCL 33604]|uniref:Uncharacterized protein n=1 Tax=Jaapia argillacea MUCL 33604 TaxID=933084 RepID=A0A067PI37_9AGAM|nr:hypothetical protein JAAARDRAFT_141443 [Jaapia argillacea MUCL 33604]